MGIKVVVVIRTGDAQRVLGLSINPLNDLVEDVEIPLMGILRHHSRFLEQKVGYFACTWLA